MNSQELNTYIDRVLGNSLRCLLPSYWWKRLLKLMVGYIESVNAKVDELASGNVFTLTLEVNEGAEDDNTTKPNEVNALIRQKIIENFYNNKPCTIFAGLEILEGGQRIIYNVPIPAYTYMDGILILVSETFLGEFLLNEDGSCTVGASDSSE